MLTRKEGTNKRLTALLISTCLVIILVLGLILTNQKPSSGASLHVEWTTQADFNSNASTTADTTTRSNVQASAGGDLTATISPSTEYLLQNANGYDQYMNKSAYDSTNNRYFVVWEDQREDYDIYGRLVNLDGTLVGASEQLMHVYDVPAFSQSGPDAAFDSINNRFLVT